MNKEQILETETDFIQSDKFDDNIEKYGYNDNTCECCGKQLKNKNNAIQTLEGPRVILAKVTNKEIEDAGLNQQGLFILGSDCIKKYPKEYRIKF
jgi:hypothetical protein